jgi:hypothetical protein
VPILVFRLSRFVRTRLTGWRLPLAIALFVFLTSWALMALVEPADNEITRPATTGGTSSSRRPPVGYGDFFPTSALATSSGVRHRRWHRHADAAVHVPGRLHRVGQGQAPEGGGRAGPARTTSCCSATAPGAPSASSRS